VSEVIVIPARYRSSRFPGKPLAEISGVPMIVRVAEICHRALDRERVYVATDDQRIVECCETNGIQWILTPDTCLTGTDRLFEASKQVRADYYINVQGDEPLIDPQDITVVIDSVRRNKCVVNAMCTITDPSERTSSSVPKVVIRPDRTLIYMSRSPIPGNKEGRAVATDKQVCIYGLPYSALRTFGVHGKKTPLEETEDIEILRFVELGIPVKMERVSSNSIAVDHPEDVCRVEAALDDLA
jgi:3-deoxy-manno-octulosonate cytidylyltransferase (CMP-KDO synthetase)